ncbi:MAG: ankyrin repeat domain-containing protein [Alphaproteobacteria bacterium]|nr:ankyrin repeat domain-containing protein [Alphaproteobacteria bacterium]
MSLKRFFNRLRLGNTLDKPGLEGETLLTRAVKTGDLDTVREFLDLGADPNAKNKSGEAPLHIALTMENLKIMHLLLETGADIFKKQNGLTLREHAEKLELKSIARALRELEARKQEALIAAASAMPMGMMGVAIMTPPPMRNVVLRDHLKEDGSEKPAANDKPKKPRGGTDSRGPK